MQLSGLHFLLTYQCNFECDHCFVWGSPWQDGTMTGETITRLLDQAVEHGVKSIYFEGGEPFLYYPIMLRGIREAATRGFRVGIVSNSYWALSEADAAAWLEPFAGLIDDLSVSSDLFHYSEAMSTHAKNAETAAAQLGIPIGVISIAQPEMQDTEAAHGQLPIGESGLMFRGRAAAVLASKVEGKPWKEFTTCPYENLVDPGRVHVDPFGHVHICQGISLGSMLDTHLNEICERYEPQTHPIVGPILDGGPVALVERYDVPHEASYADACHLCDAARRALRPQFPDILSPDQMYGIPEG